MKSSSVTIQMKAIEQYFPVVLFIMLYEVVQTFEHGCNSKVRLIKSVQANNNYFLTVNFFCFTFSTTATFVNCHY